MKKIEKNDTLQIGAEVNAEFAEKFRRYCKKHDFKQKALIPRLVEWWLSLDPINQEHIYRGRELGAHVQISEEARGRSAVHRAKAQTTNQKQKMARKSSKSA